MTQQYNDIRHINKFIDEGNHEVKAYIEEREDEITWLSENLLILAEGLEGWEEVVENLKNDLEFYKERDERLGRK
ncbi:hypothetical protein [Enterobacter kobei]|uniref:hypothetical protein n=1 Tax=Enterobacter kobei TaxID=208224 RepID=UPI0024477BD6|nr:hypothetical protein [Enterobacter kobei]MDH1372015.1 hypothetical protein [Enterobacter kobei]MDH1990417.1 hypothetical protein [Enterobacter kobei]MDH2008289.1 hypothetical protein [Enterobacter kobei]